MVDYLTTNWTEKIKNNPVANKILNKNKIPAVRYRSTRIDTHSFGAGNIVTDLHGPNLGGGIFTDPQIFAKKNFSKIQGQKIHSGEWNVSDTKQRIMDIHNTKQKKVNDWNANLDFLNDFMEYKDDIPWTEMPDYYHELIPSGMIEDDDYWQNMYVNDFINIHHPKLRIDHIQALSSQPLHIKEPSTFFSDI